MKVVNSEFGLNVIEDKITKGDYYKKLIFKTKKVRSQFSMFPVQKYLGRLLVVIIVILFEIRYFRL